MDHCHRKPEVAPDVALRKVVLVGNPNVGKSVFFGYLTGTYVEVSNYPGTTVEVSSGRSGDDLVIDTPGVYGVSSFNDEERTARDIILDADIVVNIVDAVHLERDLFLTLQLADMGIPMILALNFMDEAQDRGLVIETELLSKLLAVPVIPTVATKRKGLDKLRPALEKACPANGDPHIIEHTLAVAGSCSRREAVPVLEGDTAIAGRCGVPPGGFRDEFYIRRRSRVNDIADQVVSEAAAGRRFAHVLGRAMINPLSGLPILAGVLYLVYQLIGVFVAQTVVGFTEDTVMHGYYEPAVRWTLGHIIRRHGVVDGLLTGEFGVLTMGITYLIGLLLPLVVGFYLVLSVLEDSGYLPRLATLTDRLLSGIGLNGRAIVPIILGFGCITMATITTRLLGSKREKTIATSILNFTIPCSAQLGVIAMLALRMGWTHAISYAMVIGVCLVAVGTILNWLLPGESTPLLIDLPPIRLPRIDNVLRKTYFRSMGFIKEAYPWFLVGSLVVSVMQVTGILSAWQWALSPLTVGWLHLPRESANAIIMGMVRRDFGAAGFAAMPLTHEQTMVALIVITLFVPCVASVAVLFKERGWREAAAIWFGTWITAFLVGGIVSRVMG